MSSAAATTGRRRSRTASRRDGETALKIEDIAASEVTARLARVEGQIRAVQRMIDERRDCHTIVQQLGAARTALERATAQLMVCSLATCIRSAKTGSDEADIRKLMDTFTKLL